MVITSGISPDDFSYLRSFFADLEYLFLFRVPITEVSAVSSNSSSALSSSSWWEGKKVEAEEEERSTGCCTEWNVELSFVWLSTGGKSLGAEEPEAVEAEQVEGVEREQNAENELGIGGSAQEEKKGVVAMVVVVGELEGADIDRVKIVLGFDPLK